MNAVDSITPAIEHTRQQLFKPFRIGQWTKLAFVGLLAGELGSSGLSRSNFSPPTQPGLPHIDLPSPLGTGLELNPAVVAALVAGVIAMLAIGVIMLYVGSVMRFILFDSILERECHIRWDWSRRLGPGWHYFVWKLLYLLFSVVGIGVVVGIPLAVAFAKGWLKEPNAHLPALVLGGAILLFVLLTFLLATAVILVLTKDFVIPQMALENVDVMEGWRRFWPMMQADMGAYAGYIVMKIVLNIIVGIMIGIAALILGLFFVVPTLGLSILAVVTGKTAGLTWNVYTITLAVVVGFILLAFFLYLVSLISVPAIVFFPAYSIYFFASRYPRLSSALYSASSAAQALSGALPSPSPPSL